MKMGNRELKDLTEQEVREILQAIISDCRIYAGDSYSDFGRTVTTSLKAKELIEYGD